MGTAVREREKLADALLAAGAQAPTLCEGWTARDLAAHVVVRDRRPDAALGMFISPLAGHLKSVTDGYLGDDFAVLVDKVRSGAALSPMRLRPIDDAVNTLEFAVHTEDVRRGTDGWQPLPRDPDIDAAIIGRLKIMRTLVGRKSPVSVAIKSHDGFSAGPADAKVTVTGDPLELLLFCFGRQRAADVEYDGSPPDVLAAKNAKLGI